MFGNDIFKIKTSFQGIPVDSLEYTKAIQIRRKQLLASGYKPLKPPTPKQIEYRTKMFTYGSKTIGKERAYWALLKDGSAFLVNKELLHLPLVKFDLSRRELDIYSSLESRMERYWYLSNGIDFYSMGEALGLSHITMYQMDKKFDGVTGPLEEILKVRR